VNLIGEIFQLLAISPRFNLSAPGGAHKRRAVVQLEHRISWHFF